MSAIKNRPARGLTLVELMVAMVIGLVVVLVATRLFVGSRATQRATDETAALFETGQMVLELLGREIANAGFYPVVSTEPTVGSGVPSTNVLVSYDAAVKGLNGGSCPTRISMASMAARTASSMPRSVGVWPTGQVIRRVRTRSSSPTSRTMRSRWTWGSGGLQSR